jgi:hypothetical protein
MPFGVTLISITLDTMRVRDGSVGEGLRFRDLYLTQESHDRAIAKL